VFHTLPADRAYRPALPHEGGQKQIHHRGLANAHFATQDDQLPRAVRGAHIALLELRHLGLPPHDRTRFQAHGRVAVLRPQKSIPLPPYRLQVLGRCGVIA
jgi:hypothetical protein